MAETHQFHNFTTQPISIVPDPGVPADPAALTTSYGRSVAGNTDSSDVHYGN
jgi:hypothetical protein